MKKPIIPVIFATNNGYAPYASVTINSMIANSSRNYFYQIYVFHTELNDKNIELLESMNGENYSVKCLCVERFIEREMKYMYTNFHFSKEMFYRILIPSIFPEYDRAVYLDCDIVVLGDIAEFYNTDLHGNIIGGVNDIMHGRSKSYVKNELGIDPTLYINSGVLVIDCKAFRDNEIKEKCFAELAVRTQLRYPDQDIINLVCANKIEYLHRKWNYIWHYHIVRDDPSLNLAPDEMRQYLADASDIRILHYTSNVKPWKNKNVPLSNHFWNYVDGCPFEESIKHSFKCIDSKSYIGYHFLDNINGKYKFTLSLYTIEGITLEDVLLYVDGNEIDKNFLFSHVIEIAGKVYNRQFFDFSVDMSSLTENARIVVYNKNTGIPMPIISAWTFPVNFALGDTLCTDGRMLYKDAKAFIMACSTPELEESRAIAKVEALEPYKNDPVYQKSLKVRKLYKLLKPFFKKPIWLISDRVDAAGDNGEAFFKFLARKKTNIKPVFVINKSSKDYRRMKKYGKVVAAGSTMHQIYYLFATANISGHLENEIASPIFCKNFLKDILSKCKVVFLQHGIIKDDLSFCYNRSKDNMSIFVTSALAEYNSIVSIPEYSCGPEIVKLTGLPRYDYLDNKVEKTVFIVPTWRRSCIADLKTNELIADVEESQYFRFYNDLLHDERLLTAAKKNGYKICFYPHPIMDEITKKIKIEGDVFADASKYTYNDVFCKGALMLTDYSSTQFDFAYLRKPIVYTHFDKDEFFTSHTYAPGYFEYERDGFGEVVYDLESTVTTLIEYMENDCKLKSKYLDRINGFYAYNDRNNCQRIFDEIQKLK